MAHSVRQLYEKRPYPAVDLTQARVVPCWRLPPMEWIEAMWGPRHGAPERILVAGCGTGNEAFALRLRFPRAEIVAVDFSPRSIRIARRMQRKFPNERTIDFRVADLTSDCFDSGGKFDFISCHGVLSYIAAATRALRNLARHLAPDGALYLGVNGRTHVSENWRPALISLGFELDHFQDTRRLRGFLTLFDSLAEHPTGRIAKMPPEYLAGDLFGPAIENRSLRHWVELGARSGLDFRGSYAAHRKLTRALNSERFDELWPRSRAEAHLIAEQVAPSAFHHMVFARTAADSPWTSRAKFLHSNVRLTGLYRWRLPRRGKSGRGLQSLRLTSNSTNTLAELQVPGWLTEFVRDLATERAPSESLSARVPYPALRRQFYLLELLGAVNLRPTVISKKEASA